MQATSLSICQIILIPERLAPVCFLHSYLTICSDKQIKEPERGTWERWLSAFESVFDCLLR